MPSIELEDTFRKEIGVSFVAGVDEAGRGAIAGPVVAAAVILPLDQPEQLGILVDVDDSKKLTALKRDTLYKLIMDVALSHGIGSVGPENIDAIGIIPANAAAMRIAISQLQPEAQGLIIDGRMRLKNVPIHQKSIIHGDRLSLSIAAASIMAKVSRDKHMIALDDKYPGYGFSSHKGYCTPQHVGALLQIGPCEVHRRTFRPLRQPLL
ncbi:MAG: ribonuclease HII [Anaerolineae bacterium]|nr:MAG: ribonuclease HII [Anaerolineae bacterium]